jgi:hypothetical protein
MKMFSTNQVAKMLGIATKTLSRYIAQGKVPAPQIIEVGAGTIHSWTPEEIEHLRKLLPTIANGRKTRYQKQRKKQAARSRKR